MSDARIIIDGLVALLTPIGAPIRNKQLDSLTNRGIALMLAGVGDDDLIAISTYTLQVRTRGLADPSDDVDTLADQVKAILHGQVAVQLAGVTIGSIRRMSWTTLGQDGTRRWERSDNYLLEGVTFPASELLPG